MLGFLLLCNNCHNYSKIIQNKLLKVFYLLKVVKLFTHVNKISLYGVRSTELIASRFLAALYEVHNRCKCDVYLCEWVLCTNKKCFFFPQMTTRAIRE